MCNESDSSSLTSPPSDDELRSPTPPTQAASPSEAVPKVVRARKRKSTKTAAPGNGTTTVSVEESTTPENRRKRKRQKGGKNKDENVEEDEKMVPSLSKALRSVVKIGAHVSMAGGVENAVRNAVSVGANAFALFLRNPQRWVTNTPPITYDSINSFIKLCIQHEYDPRTDILPHAPYLINLANPSAEMRAKSYATFLEDLQKCEQLRIQRYNFHPGTSADKTGGIKLIAGCINDAHKATTSVKIVLENAAGHSNCIGDRFEDLRGIIDLVEDQSRVGVCIDTCHAFAAGYDLRTEKEYNQTWEEFDKAVGFKYLLGLHLNDSRSMLGSRRDLHANIGHGFLGLEPFRLIVNDPRLQSVPMVLETPSDTPKTWKEEIELLYSMVGKGPGDPELAEKERVLQLRGETERGKWLDAEERKKKKQLDAVEKKRNRKEEKKEARKERVKIRHKGEKADKRALQLLDTDVEMSIPRS